MNGLRKVMRWAMDSGAAAAAGLPRPFVVAIPYGGAVSFKNPRPFTDAVLRELSDPANIRLLDEMDRKDTGLADIWSIQVQCGRRIGEVVKLRLDCVGEHLGRTWMWVDMTKVGKLDYAVQIPRDIYDLIRVRQIKTIERFRLKHGSEPTAQQQRLVALFPSRVTNPTFERSISVPAFSVSFRAWLELDAINLPGHHDPSSPSHAGHPARERGREHDARQAGPRPRLGANERLRRADRRLPSRAVPATDMGHRSREPQAGHGRPDPDRRRAQHRGEADGRSRSDPDRARAVHLQAGRRRI